MGFFSYAVKLNSISRSHQEHLHYYLCKKAGQTTSPTCQMLSKVSHALSVSLQDSWGLPVEFSEHGKAVIFIWLMFHHGQGAEDTTAKVLLTYHEQDKLAKTQCTLPLHSLRYHKPGVQCFTAYLRAMQIVCPVRHSLSL